MRKRLIILVLCALALAPALVTTQDVPKRGMTVEDTLRVATLADPHLSPDGRLVAFVVNTADAKLNRRSSAIWMAASDGSRDAWPFTTQHSARQPRWSPDGHRLAFLSARPEPDAAASAPAPRAQVFVLTVDAGGEARRLTAFTEGIDRFEWSPDGTRLACISRAAAPGSAAGQQDRSDARHYRYSGYKFDGSGYSDGKTAQVWIVDVASGLSRQVTTSDRTAVSEGPVWSADGSRLAFVGTRLDTDAEGNQDLWIVPAAGGEPARISDVAFRISRPRWSPDGRRLAYIAARDWNAILKLHVSSAAGGPSTVIANEFTFPSELAWNADGRALYALADTKGESHLYRVDLATQAVAAVTTGPRAVRQADINAAAGLITYIANDATHADDLYVADATGSNERRLTRTNDALLAQIDL
ncbi:MAG: PD40 domain-containing protein, partial [Acidobacteria bacterium]|nr:PD40 domain-containing protein [Acidobacteriota bacterium]